MARYAAPAPSDAPGLALALRFWSEHFAGKVISELTPEKIEAFIDWLQDKGHSNGYVNRTLAAGRAALNRAVKRQEVRTAPFIPALEPGEPRDIRLNMDETAALFDACQEPHILMFLILAFNTLSRPVVSLRTCLFYVVFQPISVRTMARSSSPKLFANGSGPLGRRPPTSNRDDESSMTLFNQLSLFASSF